MTFVFQAQQLREHGDKVIAFNKKIEKESDRVRFYGNIAIVGCIAAYKHLIFRSVTCLPNWSKAKERKRTVKPSWPS